MAVRFGIVGPGKVAQLHADALARLPDARLTAVAGRNEERASALAGPHGARVDPNLEAMIERGGVDAVILCTPHPLHAEQAVAAARAGLHVVVEKPMALDPAAARRMIAAAHDTGVVLSVISQRRWYEAARRVKDAIVGGRIGAPALASVEVLGWRGPEYFAMDAWRGTAAGEGGGVLVNQAVHQLDLVAWFLGPAIEIDGWVANVNHPEYRAARDGGRVRLPAQGVADLTAARASRYDGGGYRKEEGGMRLWGGRFAEPSDQRMVDFTRSIEVDAALAADDIAGSIAHVHGLGRAGLLTDAEVEALVAGLTALAGDIAAGSVTWDPALEDVHLNLEAALADKVGPVAGKLHTGRSRNDQVATDLRLWTRRVIDDLDAALVAFERSLVGLAEREGTAILPGTTHIQPAQPVLFAHHLLAYVEMAERDRGRLADARRRVNVSPLGAGALAGAGYPLDREAVAAELGFDGVTANSMDAVSDRDFVVETLAAVALGMVHLSRLAEELTWWSNPRFGFVRVSDAFSTGSSIMPNKKNPDPAELVRGRAARVIGELTGSLALLKGLPMAYQRDLQEDKAPLFDAVGVYRSSLGVLSGLLETLSVDAARMHQAAAEGYTTATAVADALVRRGIPFRAAHHIVGSLVAQAEEAGLGLDAIPDSMIGMALAAAGDEGARALAGDVGIGDELRAAAGIDGALASCDVVGGTAPSRVAAALAAARARLR